MRLATAIVLAISAFVASAAPVVEPLAVAHEVKPVVVKPAGGRGGQQYNGYVS